MARPNYRQVNLTSGGANPSRVTWLGRGKIHTACNSFVQTQEEFERLKKHIYQLERDLVNAARATNFGRIQRIKDLRDRCIFRAQVLAKQVGEYYRP